MPSIAANLERVRERIDAAAARAGRRASEVSLVVVTKGMGIAAIEEAIAAGASLIGENRVQEAREKWAAVKGRASVHLIGHLQTNKAGVAVELFDLVHSLDSVRLAEALDRRAAELGKTQRVLVEVRTTREPTKHGVEPHELPGLIEALDRLPHLRLEGLMTMGPLGEGESGARRSFAELRALGAGLEGRGARELSMGMSGDFEIAVEEGATMVRVGSAIFAADTTRRST